MIKIIFLFFIYCVNAEPRYLRHLSYATGMDGQHRYLRQPEFYKDIEKFTHIYESNY